MNALHPVSYPLNRTAARMCTLLIGFSLMAAAQAAPADSCGAHAEVKATVSQKSPKAKTVTTTIEVKELKEDKDSTNASKVNAKTVKAVSEQTKGVNQKEKNIAQENKSGKALFDVNDHLKKIAQEKGVVFNAAEELKKAAANFKERYPKTKVNSFSLTPVAGIYEAAVAKEVIYFDESARFLMAGRLLDMERAVDLTEERVKDIRRIKFDDLPLDKAVKTVYGTGKKRLAVFTDVDCPFSRRLSETLSQLTDTTVYTFLFPLTSIHPQAKAKSEAIWCAKDSSASLTAALKGEAIAQTVANNPICNAPVTDTIKLASTLGIAGTPTLINEAGNRISGALPLEKLQEFINEEK